MQSFKRILCHQNWYQSEARMRFPISFPLYIPIFYRFRDIMIYWSKIYVYPPFDPPSLACPPPTCAPPSSALSKLSAAFATCAMQLPVTQTCSFKYKVEPLLYCLVPSFNVSTKVQNPLATVSSVRRWRIS